MKFIFHNRFQSFYKSIWYILLEISYLFVKKYITPCMQMMILTQIIL